MTITKSWYAKPLYLAVALVLALGMALPVVAEADASSVSQPSVSLSTETLSVNAEYTITFDVDKPVPTTGDIVVTFPSGTTVPAAYADGDVTIQATAGFGTQFVATDALGANVTADATTRVVTIALANMPATGIGEAARVRVVFKTAADIINPSTAGDYTLTVKTSADDTAVTSAAYTIETPTPTALPGIVKVYNASNVLIDQFTGAGALVAAYGITADGFTMEIGPGTYAENLVIANELTVKSTDGAATTIIDGTVDVTKKSTIDGLTIKQAVTIGTVVGSTATDSTVKNCVLKGTGGGLTVALLTLGQKAAVTDCTIDTTGAAAKTGIAVGGADSTISGCTFTTDADDTAAVGLGANATVEDSDFSGTGAVGVGDTAGVTATISGNTFDGLDQAIGNSAGTPTYTIKDNTIKNCTTTTAGAIDITSTGATTEVTITNNTFTDNLGYILEVTANADLVKALFNTFSGNAKTVLNTDAVNTVDVSHNSWDTAPTADGTRITYLPVAASGTSDAAVSIGVATLVGKTTAGVDVTSDVAAGTIAAAKYAANPGGAVPYPALAGGFYDVYVAPGAVAADKVTVKLYNDAVTDNTLVYVWSDLSGAWTKCDTQGVNTISGFAYVTLTTTSAPAILDLAGMPFALVEKPAPAPAGPGLVVLGTPKDGVTGTAINTIPFTWNSVAGADSYIWQLSTDAAQTAWVDRQALTSTAYTYSVTDLDYETPYYWKVTAGKGLALSQGAIKGTVLAVSEIQTFITGEEPAAAIVYTSPYTGETFTDETAFLAHMNYYDAQAQAQTQPAPSWVWVLIGIGAVLVIVTLVLIFRSRKV